METIREILASHESGISRGGLLAWARLRGDPKMTDAQLDAALTELGDQVIDVQGFLYLREFAPASALKEAAAEASHRRPHIVADGRAHIVMAAGCPGVRGRAAGGGQHGAA